MKTEELYTALNPWAEADLPNLRGLSPRITNMAYKTIGLAYNDKLGAKEILAEIERKLKERYPSINTSWFAATGVAGFNGYLGRENDPVRPEFSDWIKSVDAVVASVGS